MALDARRTLTIAASIACVASAVVWVLTTAGTQPAPHVAIAAEVGAFDAGRAFRETGALAQNYPNRVVGTAQSRRAAAYMKTSFDRLGYRTTVRPFTMWLHGAQVRGQDVVAYRPGSMPESIAILAHFDEATTANEAAEDDASGVGVELELAREMRARPLRHGLIFVATDAEEWGMIGARAAIPDLRAHEVEAAIVVDYVNAGASTGVRLDCTGQFEGYSPMWLRALVSDAAAAEHVGVVEQPMGAVEWMYRAVELSLQDQGPLLDAGIPAINVETIPADVAAARTRYHTPNDAFRNFGGDASSFAKMGATVERAIYSLDAMTPPAADGDGDFLVAPAKVMPARWMLAAQTVVLVSCVLIAFVGILGAGRGDLWTSLSPALWSTPLIAGVLALQALALTNVLPRYELYPATTKDPFLYTIPAQAAVPALAVFALVIFGLVRMRPANARTPTFAAEKRAVVTWLGAVLLVAFLVNPYGALAFVAPVELAASLTMLPISGARRLINAIVLLAGALPFTTLLWFFSGELYLGWHILWYLALQAAYGTWSLLVVALFSIVLASWLRSSLKSVVAN